VQMPSDPGPTIRLQISPVGTIPAPPPPVIASYQQPIYVQPAQVLVVPQAYPGYYTRPYIPSIGFEFDFSDGDSHRGRRHWR